MATGVGGRRVGAGAALGGAETTAASCSSCSSRARGGLWRRRRPTRAARPPRIYRGKIDRPKGRKTCRVRLSVELAVADRLSRQADDDALIFTTERGGRIDPSNVMARVLKPTAEADEIGRWPGFHTFRHTAAASPRLFVGGWNAKQVAKLSVIQTRPSRSARISICSMRTCRKCRSAPSWRSHRLGCRVDVRRGRRQDARPDDAR